MEKWLAFIQNHAQHAHWVIFGASLLAGMNVPISIDFLIILSAILAATIASASTTKLFLSIFLGCALSAWIAYWIGRKLGPQLLKLPVFSKILSEARMKKIKKFYDKRGPFALILGRFIPFGIRNGLYMTSGISRMPFPKFILWEGLACAIWSSVCFWLYYLVGKNIDTVYSQVKIVNLCIFAAFGVTVIGIIWYKKKKNKREENV